MNWDSGMNQITVGDLIKELMQLDPSLKLVTPDAPYGEPVPLTYIGIVTVKKG